MRLRFTFIQNLVVKKWRYVRPGEPCVDVCGVLDRGLNGGHNVTPLLCVGDDKDSIAAWGEDPDRMLRISIPPTPPGTSFGLDELPKEIICLAETLRLVALIGPVGIGKTRTSLTVPHDRIEDGFGDNRRFILGDRFPTSLAHLLGRIFEAIGADIGNLEGLTPFRSFLPPVKMSLVPDNAGFIFGRQGTEAPGEYSAVEELSRFSNMCLCVASRTPTSSSPLERPITLSLSMEPECDIVRNLFQQLGFYTLSITLLAATAAQNAWDYDRLAKEWKVHCGQMPWTEYTKGLVAAIELALASTAFQTLGPSALELLAAVIFFPQGIPEEYLDHFFPTVPNRRNIVDELCALSLTHRSNGFITTVAPIRDHLGLRDQQSSPPLHAAKDWYFKRLMTRPDPNGPEFAETRWILLEDWNVERLLVALITIDANADDVWEGCIQFMRHLYWHKPRQTALKSKIEGLPDTHRSKPECLFQLSRLCQSVGNHVEQRRLLTHALELERVWGDERKVAQVLGYLSDASRLLGSHREGIRQAGEASEVYERLGDTIGRATCLNNLAWLLLGDGQLNAAEDAASRTLKLIPEKGQEFLSCETYRVLGDIHHFKNRRKAAIHNFTMALQIASPYNWHIQLFWVHYSLAKLFLKGNGFDDAHDHIEEAKLHATEDTYHLGRAMEMQARISYQQRRLENATSEALRALGIFEKLGAVEDAESCRGLLRKIERATTSWFVGFQR